jgi:cytochrome o ubiquinol oxidase operon protein cyoD
MQTSTQTTEHMMRNYIIGFGLALVLTAIAFALTATKALGLTSTLVTIAVLAIIQVVVHLRYFLHIDFKSSPRENILALAFTAVLIVIMAGGTLWIMFDLHYRMMN